MSLTQEEEDNLKLAQLKFSIDQKLISKDHNSSWIIEKLGSISSRLVATAYLELNGRDLIGCTALHFALISKDLEALGILLSYGADFTAKNHIGSSALHAATEQLYSNNGDVEYFKTHFENEFANTILKAHIDCKNFENPLDRNGFSHFHAACMINYTELVDIFLGSGVSIDDAVNNDSPYFPGYTPLHFAAKFFALETVEILLKQGVHRTLKDAQGLTPLHLLLERSITFMKSEDDKKYVSAKEFIKSKIVKIIRLFVDDTCDSDMMAIDEFGFSQFHLICTTQNLSLIEHYTNKLVSIDHAVNMGSPLCPGYTGLHFAALFSIDIVKMLMKKGANLAVKDAKGMTPFDLCLEIYKAEEIHTILSLHPVWKDIAFGNKKTKSSNTFLRSNTKLLDLVLALRDQDEFVTFARTSIKKANVFIPLDSSLWPGFTPLHVAVCICKNSIDWKNFNSIITQLCQYGGDVNSQDSRGRTPLNLAFRQGKHQLVERLIEHCRRISKPVDTADEDGLSNLHIICSGLHSQSLVMISNEWLSNRIDMNVAYKGPSTISSVTPGSTPLHVGMATSYHWHFIMMRLGKYADIMARDSNGLTPIHWMLIGKVKERETFAEMKLPSSLRDCVVEDIQLSHLHVACRFNDKTSVGKLIDQGADVNKAIVRRTNGDIDSRFDELVGFTPLHFAANNIDKYRRNRAVMELLIQCGADVLAKDSIGMTPLYTSLATNVDYSDLFTPILKNNSNLQTRMEKDVGLTMLHVACRFVDVDMVKDLLSRGAKVNAQVHADSPIWPGFTPLHVWASFVEKSDDREPLREGVLKMLLESNADVALSDADGNTPLHVICRICSDSSFYRAISGWKLALLRAHRNFHVNLANVQGISSFQLACMLGELNVVEKFLIRGKVDVNQPVDPFSVTLAGCTSLHLAIRHSYLRHDLFSHVHMVDLLLRYGADVHAEDSYGDTPIHDAVRYHFTCEDLLERLIRGGADVNGHNVKGETPMELLLQKSKIPVDKVRYFLKCGCRFNTMNPVTGKSYWAVALSSMDFAALQNLIFKVSINFPDLLKPDEQGRNIVHNFVSVSTFNITITEYNQMIQKLLRKNCGIDDQDQLGRIALHFAVELFNCNAVSVLLNAGADINITDSCGQSAFTNISEEKWMSIKMIKNYELTVAKFVEHAKKLLFCGLYVSPINLKELAQELCQEIALSNPLDERFEKEVNEIKNMKIDTYSLTLGDFLSELGAVSDYPTMSQMKRDAIDELFTSIDNDFCDKYREVVGLLRLQYRKALARVELAERANESLIVVAGFRLPDVCSQIILRFLTNSDLKNLIASTIENEGD